MPRLPALILSLNLLLLAGVTQAAPNLLSNGSFEQPGIHSQYALYSSGSKAIAGWTVVGADVQLTRTEFVPAADGKNWVDLTGVYGYDKGLRSDAVRTTAGQHYRLSFDLGDYYLAGFQTATLAVSINGAPQTLFTNVYQGGVMDWERMSFDWVANSGSAQITFLGVANGKLSNNAVIGLDNVVFEQLSAVPEPSTYAMLLAGLALVGAAMRRKAG
ncbi:PEPxxWA-CTERM sorting domain-containing protein [Janthinobacterium fluminis]|uniref:DUF642 domain-containing protein n=1 Tax=Janthinobacterium fluminis TaxID=2987524 RepID=A0ABT5K0T8_9BURK|nr:PEPxxWA-CTERM sorting domain-containing protein [Janthinobacterium fluminis]MDC8758611.1 DUF642 domain-containing protein [Janthinobacterium fluminis]